jgi:hypothetical protein
MDLIAREALPFLVVLLFGLIQAHSWLRVHDVRREVDTRIEGVREEFGTRLARLESRARLGLDESP